MAQYDVYPNPSRMSAVGIPYVVVIQSDLLDALATRMVIPLAAPDFEGKVPERLSPLMQVKGRKLRALAHYAAPLPTRLLRRPVANLAGYASELVAALDVVLAGV